MNKKMFCVCSLLIASQTHGFYGPRVHNAQIAFYNPLKLESKDDFMSPDYRKVESKYDLDPQYDDLRLPDLEDKLIDLSSKDLEPKDKERIR